MQEHFGALVSAQLWQRNPGRSKADLSASTATGHRSQLATGRAVTAAALASGAGGKSLEKEGDDEEEKRRAELRRAQDPLKQRVEVEDYTGAAPVRVGGEEREQLRAGLLHAQEQLKKCLQDISALMGLSATLVSRRGAG